MAEEKRPAVKHKIIIEYRNNALLTGVTDVISFDEEKIIADTESGIIVIKGANLHVNNLNLDNAELDIDGEIDSVTYSDQISRGKNKQSVLSKIFK